jgi:hypothetical protein
MNVLLVISLVEPMPTAMIMMAVTTVHAALDSRRKEKIVLI